MFRKLEITLLSALLVAILAASAFGWGESNPRAIAMGGAYTALAKNLEAPYWNPANLGLSTNKGFSINMFNVGVGLRNNSFSLSDYNKYNGKFLTDGDKEDILNSIPADGLSLDVLAEASVLNFSFGSLAVTYKGYAATKANLDRDPFELLFYGNAVKHDVSLSNTASEGYGIGDAAFSYGYSPMVWSDGELSVGASAHYLRGIAYQKILEAQGGVSTTDSGFVGSGQMTMRTALGGSGFAFDGGLAVRFKKDWLFSAAWQNIYSKLIWNNDTEETFFTFDMQPITIESAADSTASDSLVTSNDTTYSVGSFSSDLPSVVKLGLAREYDKLTWAVDWTQAITIRPGQGINPRVSAGIEYRPISQIPLRAGMALGGSLGSTFSAGFGLYFGPYHFDLGVANSGSPLPNHTKGAQLALGMGLYF